MPGPHDFAVRTGLFVGMIETTLQSTAPTASHTHVRDDRETPLMRGGTAPQKHNFGKSESFFWGNPLHHCDPIERSSKINFPARQLWRLKGSRWTVVAHQSRKISRQVICPTAKPMKMCRITASQENGAPSPTADDGFVVATRGEGGAGQRRDRGRVQI
jgi:hypothetical protein